jgi:hypothetical protein
VLDVPEITTRFHVDEDDAEFLLRIADELADRRRYSTIGASEEELRAALAQVFALARSHVEAKQRVVASLFRRYRENAVSEAIAGREYAAAETEDREQHDLSPQRWLARKRRGA